MELTIILMLFVLFVIFLLLSWLPIMNALGKFAFTLFGIGLAIVLAFLTFNVQIVSPNPAVNTAVITGISNSTYTNQTITYTYITDMSQTATTIENTYIFSYLFFGIGLLLFIRLYALAFVMIAEGVHLTFELDRQGKEDTDGIDE